MRWYLNSLLDGELGYFMPAKFTALLEDLEFYKEFKAIDINNEEIIDKIDSIWHQVKSFEYKRSGVESEEK